MVPYIPCQLASEEVFSAISVNTFSFALSPFSLTPPNYSPVLALIFLLMWLKKAHFLLKLKRSPYQKRRRTPTSIKHPSRNHKSTKSLVWRWKKLLQLSSMDLRSSCLLTSCCCHWFFCCNCLLLQRAFFCLSCHGTPVLQHCTWLTGISCAGIFFFRWPGIDSVVVAS